MNSRRSGLDWLGRRLEETLGSCLSAPVVCHLWMAAVAGMAAPAVNGAELALEWSDNSDNESGFTIERALPNDRFVTVASVGPNVTRFVDKGLPASKQFRYRVCAFNSAGKSGYSNIAIGRTADAPPLSISAIPDVEMNSAESGVTVGFSILIGVEPAGGFSLSVASSNPNLLPAEGILLGGSGMRRTLRLTPFRGRVGVAAITVTVGNGESTFSQSFRLSVVPFQGPVIVEDPSEHVPAKLRLGEAATFRVVANSSWPVTYQWFLDGEPITGASASTYTIPSAQRFHAGTYHVEVVANGVTARGADFPVAFGDPVASGSRLSNLSARITVRRDRPRPVVGFVIAGHASKRMLLRAVGPTLGLFGVPGVLSDPAMMLRRWNGQAYVDLAGSDDWLVEQGVSEILAATSNVGTFPLEEQGRDAALVADVAAGLYGIQIDGAPDDTGIVLVELYDADTDDNPASIVNMSILAYSGSGSEALIPGFVISHGIGKSLLIRAVGPTLAGLPFGLAGMMSDPRLDIFRRNQDGSESLLLSIDDWTENTDAENTRQTAARVGAFELAPGSGDAAFVVSLPPGVYSAVARSSNGRNGVVLVEIYEVPQP